jgi:mRNA interferase MazF
MVSDFDIDKMYCGAIRRGDVFLCNLNKKEQAVLILQDDILNQGLPTIVCALIEPYKQDEEIFPNEVLLKSTETGLGKDGICMLHKILTINRHNIFAKKGELSLEKMKEIYQALDVNLGRFRD